jgi:hypothetical protein
MKKLSVYIRGFLIGIIAEYSFRVEFSHIQAIILILLIATSLVDVIFSWKD